MHNEDSSNDQKIDSLDTESGSPDISNGKLSADEVNLRLRQVVTDDHRQQVIVSGVQASLPDMTALLEQAEEAQAQILKEQKVYNRHRQQMLRPLWMMKCRVRTVFSLILPRVIFFLTGMRIQELIRRP